MSTLQKTKVNIRFRPHHFLCTFCFEGKGYSPQFVRNYKQIVEQIHKDPDTLIEVVNETDDICTPCPHRRNQLCETQTKIEGLDQRHSNMLHLQTGDVLSWNDALTKIKQHVTLPKFHAACETCQWKAYGICEAKIKDYIK